MIALALIAANALLLTFVWGACICAGRADDRDQADNARRQIANPARFQGSNILLHSNAGTK